jgi:hypothetical protein
MALFSKKSDPISAHERALKAEIAALEGQIKRLATGIEHAKSQPRLRSTALPHSSAVPSGSNPNDLVEVDRHVASPTGDHDSSPAQYNDLGIRKYDLGAAVRRLISHFRGQPPANPKLVSLLAAGNIQGLRPLRYEKRVARNRFIGLVTLLVFVLWGIIAMFYRNR